MKSIFVILSLFTINEFGMDCVSIKSVSEIEQYLAKHGKKLGDDDEQLATNLAFIYRLPTGEVALVPNRMRPESKGLLFVNEDCFQECIRKDSFPVENDEREMFEYDLKGQRNIHENIVQYHAYLNKRIKLGYTSLDRSNVQAYYEGVCKIKKKQRMDILALGAIMGELFRKELNGRWIVEKWYGTYNPYYKPLIVHPNTNRIESPYDKLVKMIERKEMDASKFFFVLPMTPYPTLNTLKESGKEVIELQ